MQCMTGRGAWQVAAPRLYEDLMSYDAVKTTFERVLAKYNATRKPMNLVLFDNALEHLVRLERVLQVRPPTSSA